VRFDTLIFETRKLLLLLLLHIQDGGLVIVTTEVYSDGSEEISISHDQKVLPETLERII